MGRASRLGGVVIGDGGDRLCDLGSVDRLTKQKGQTRGADAIQATATVEDDGKRSHGNAAIDSGERVAPAGWWIGAGVHPACMGWSACRLAIDRGLQDAIVFAGA